MTIRLLVRVSERENESKFYKDFDDIDGLADFINPFVTGCGRDNPTALEGLQYIDKFGYYAKENGWKVCEPWGGPMAGDDNADYQVTLLIDAYDCNQIYVSSFNGVDFTDIKVRVETVHGIAGNADYAKELADAVRADYAAPAA